MLPRLQLGRFLAALAVVCFHANLTIALPKYFGTEVLPLARAGFAGVEFFFVLSGFVIVAAHWRDITGEARPWLFAWKRVRRIYPPVWVILAVLTAAVTVAPGLSPVPDLGPTDILWSFLLLPPLDAVRPEPLLTVLWTLRFEMLFYALFLLFLLHRGVGLIAAAAVLVLSAASLAWAESPHLFWVTPFPLLFALGAGAAAVFMRGARMPGRVLLVAGALVLAGAVAIAAQVPGGYHRTWLSLLFGLGAGGCILGAAVLDRARPLASHAAVLGGDASYAIYLVHFPLISILCKVAVKVPGLPAWAAFGGMVAASVIAGTAFHLIVERPLLRWIPARPA